MLALVNALLYGQNSLLNYLNVIREILNKTITLIKGEQFELDYRIPLSYLLCFFINKGIMLICGIWKLRRFSRVFIHHSSVIKCQSMIQTSKNLCIDRCCYIDALSSEGIVFGNNVSIGKNTTIECTGTLKSLGKGLRVCDNVGLGSHGFFGCAGGIEIGENTIFGNYVSLHSENHNYNDVNVPIRLQGVNRKGIKIGKDCWIGAKVTILDGAEIGDGCIVAAGAVVRGKYEPYSIIGGVPSKIIKKRI